MNEGTRERRGLHALNRVIEHGAGLVICFDADEAGQKVRVKLAFAAESAAVFVELFPQGPGRL